MLLLTILSYYMLFHLKLVLSIVDYFTVDYFKQFQVILIYGYWWLLYWWLLVVILLGLLVTTNGIGSYSIGGY